MNKYNLTLIPLLLLMCSCGPASSGTIYYEARSNCTSYAVLQNRSSTEKITFEIEEHVLLNDTPKVYQSEETLEPQEIKDLGCTDDNVFQENNWHFTKIEYTIVGAHVVTTQ